VNEHRISQESIAADGTVHTRTYYPLFDYLRAAAALGVFASHSDPWHIFPENLGNACVQIFFALSGFLIGGILLSTPAKGIPRFYFNRSTRIWIPYFIGLSMVALVAILKQPLSDSKLWEILFYKLTFVYNIFGTSQLTQYVDRFPLQGTANHFWSICVEEQFYLIAPFVVIFVRRWIACLVIASLIVNLFVPHDFASISIGLLLALSLQQFGEWYLRPIAKASIAAALIFSAAALFLKPDLYAQIIPISAGSIVALLAITGRQQRFGRVIGGMSYPFYLNTWVVFFALNFTMKMLHENDHSKILDVVGLMFAVAFSFLHYWFVDRAIVEKRRGFYSRAIGISACTAGFVLFSCGVAVGIALRYAG
jgi:peptidoglycan/LPS O-acetylase OafA/YrhL